MRRGIQKLPQRARPTACSAHPPAPFHAPHTCHDDLLVKQGGSAGLGQLIAPAREEGRDCASRTGGAADTPAGLGASVSASPALTGCHKQAHLPLRQRSTLCRLPETTEGSKHFQERTNRQASSKHSLVLEAADDTRRAWRHVAAQPRPVSAAGCCQGVVESDVSQGEGDHAGHAVNTAPVLQLLPAGRTTVRLGSKCPPQKILSA